MKKWTVRMLALLAALSLCACEDDEWDEETEEPEVTTEPVETKEEPKDTEVAAKKEHESDLATRLSVNRSSGKMTIDRKSLGSKRMGSNGDWTILVYLCGTNLESGGGGMATMDMQEMLDGTEGGNIRYVVQTGGTEDWDNDIVDPSKLERFVLDNGEVSEAWSGKITSMGQESTLEDFLSWSLSEYPAEHMGLIFWDHGSGSINGVCFDELYDDDSLCLRDIDTALNAVSDKLTAPFDFIGFDACLMGTLEAANVLAPYASYMYGSEEIEPGYGWDYQAMGEHISEGGADGASLGKVVCDSFYDMCEEIDSEDQATLSVIDLEAIDDVLTSFNDFSKDIFEAGNDAASLASMIRGIESADNFGGNNKSEGYTNMVDLAGLVNACSDYSSNAKSVISALNKAVVYQIHGRDHKNAGGLSLYYPLSIQGSNEMGMFADVCVSPYYLSFVDRQGQGSVGNYSSYDDSSWFDDDDEWYWGEEDEDDSYWDYIDSFEQTGESSLITFDVEPTLDDEGDFWFALDEDGLYYAADVYAYVYQLSEDGEDAIELGETYDINADWDEGIFCDNFDGYWLSLSDGQNLATYIVDVTDEYIVYTSPIRLNGEETNLRLRQFYDGTVVVDGTWDGIDESGMAARDIYKLQNGDVITPLYYAFELEGDDEEFFYHGNDFTVKGALQIEYNFMDDGDYLYAFCIDDVYGDYYLTDFEMFNVTDGEVSFYED